MLVRMQHPDSGVVADVHPDMVDDYRSGGYQIVSGQDAPALPTRDEIAKMKKPQVVEWLEAHGVESPKGAVADLREALAEIMFVG